MNRASNNAHTPKTDDLVEVALADLVPYPEQDVYFHPPCQAELDALERTSGDWTARPP